LATAWPSLLFAQEWTRFRGPNGSGVGAAATVPLAWTAADYNWKVKLPGNGHSSPVLWGDWLFVTCGEEATGKRLALCLDAVSGKELWSRPHAAAKPARHALNSLASITPAVDAERVYLCWPAAKEFLVVALDHHGAEKWRVDLGPFRGGHGAGASPVVHDGLLIVPHEHNGDSCLVALDCRSGKQRWRVPRAKEGSWSTPCVFRPKGGPPQLIVTNYRQGIAGLDPETGRTLWELDVFDKRHAESSIGSPIVAGELVLGACGWLGVRQEVVAVRPDAGAGKAARVWTIQRSVPLCTTPLVKDGLLFLWSDEGIVSCADVATGKVHWRERVEGTFYASPVWVDGRVYNVNTDGDVYVLAAAREFKQLARNALGEGTHSTPAVAGGRMYLRTFAHVISLGRR
jgi:outer membrane protein assembly factor BamB